MLLLLVLSFCATSFAWGPEGHYIVGALAQTMLKPQTQTALLDLLRNYSLSDVADDPDDYAHEHGPQDKGGWSEHLHFTNLPKDATNFTYPLCTASADGVTPLSCVIGSINNFTAQLKQQGPTAAWCKSHLNDRVIQPCPLIFVTHFVGDAHQPLHIAYFYDRGGNEVDVEFFGEKSNLHKVWDSDIISHWLNGRDWPAMIPFLQTYIENNQLPHSTILDPAIWADESFNITRFYCYNFTTEHGIAQLGQDYYDMAFPFIQERLAVAGIRLAGVLNSIFASK
jgi:hypothetical protein